MHAVVTGSRWAIAEVGKRQKGAGGAVGGIQHKKQRGEAGVVVNISMISRSMHTPKLRMSCNSDIRRLQAAVYRSF